MNAPMTRFPLLALVVGAALLAPQSAHASQSPSLGELALKEQARRKALKGTGKVLTNDDVPRAAAPPWPPQGTPALEPRAAVKDEPRKPDEPAASVRDEAWWKQRISQVREELRRNEMFADALQTRINSLTNDFTMRDDPHQRAVVAEQRSKAILELDRVKADLELNRKKIDEIEEEARRAGVPPGWLR